MKLRRSWPWFAGVLALGFAMSVEAGYPQQAYFSCYKNSDGSGGCYGSLAGARASTDPNAYVEFESYVGSNSTTLNHWFYAYQNGTSYSCQLTSSSSPALVSAWSQAMSSRGYVSVWWDASGTCVGMTVIAASQWYY